MIKVKKFFYNLYFAIKNVFFSAPYNFIFFFIIQLLKVSSYYIILYINSEILNIIGNAIIGELTEDIFVFKIAVLLILFVFVSIMTIILDFFGTLLMQRQSIKFNKYVGSQMAFKSLELDISYFDNPDFYDGIAKANEGKIRLEFLVYRVIFFITNFISFTIALYFSILINIKFAFLIIFLTLPIFISNGKYFRKKYSYEDEMQKEKRKTSYLAKLILGKYAAKEIRFYHIESFVVDKYKTNWGKYSFGLSKIIKTYGRIDSLMAILPMLGIMIAMYYVVSDIISGQNQIGDFTYFFGIYTGLSSSLSCLIEDLSKLGESELAINNYKNFMSLKTNLQQRGNNELLEIKSIKFVNVSFKYPQSESWVLKNVSFELSPKGKNAIVGINGSGKTTLIKLLLRFYDVDDGEILINDINIKEYDIRTVRKCFSAVFQDYVIYSLSLRDNIAVSDYINRDDDLKIYKVLEFAGLKKLLKFKNFSLDMLLSRDFSDDGLELSEGEKQKIAIARSMFSSAKILIFDEATARLDAKSESELFLKLEELYNNKGIIFISHRLTNMSSMDNILVFNNGRLIESGNHMDLLKLNGEYYKLYMLQARKYEE